MLSIFACHFTLTHYIFSLQKHVIQVSRNFKDPARVDLAVLKGIPENWVPGSQRDPRKTGKLGSGTLRKLENRNPSQERWKTGTLVGPQQDSRKTGKPGPQRDPKKPRKTGTLVGPQKNRKTGTQLLLLLLSSSSSSIITLFSVDFSIPPVI